MAKYQIGKELKPNDKQVKGIINLYNSIPNNPFLHLFFDKYRAVFHIDKQRAYEGPCNGPSNPLASNAMQGNENENEQIF